MNIAAILMASGISSRFGGHPKLLALLKGKPLWKYVAEAIPSDMPRVIVSCHDEILEGARKLGFISVRNDLRSPGTAITLRMGLNALDLVDGCLFFACDQPLLKKQTILRLVHEFTLETDIIAPMANGSKGNPVLFGRSHFPALRALSPTQSGSDVINNAPVKYIDTNPQELWDIDTQEDLEKVKAFLEREDNYFENV